MAKNSGSTTTDIPPKEASSSSIGALPAQYVNEVESFFIRKGISAHLRTVVGEEKQLFVGELSISYLSAAPLNEVCEVNGSIVRSGRNLTVVAMEFRMKRTEKLAHIARATLCHLPIAKL